MVIFHSFLYVYQAGYHPRSSVASGVLEAQDLCGIRGRRGEGVAESRRRQQGTEGHRGNEDGLRTQMRLQLFPGKDQIKMAIVKSKGYRLF